MIHNKENVTIQDIQDVSKGIGIELNPEQLETLYNEYNREVMDKGESWDELVKILILKQGTIEYLKGLNK